MIFNYINKYYFPILVEDFSNLNRLSPEISEVILCNTSDCCPDWYPTCNDVVMSPEIYADKIIPEAWKLVDKHKKKVDFLYWGEKKFRDLKRP